MIYSILPPKAEGGWVKPDQCQENSMWIELAYYIETLPLTTDFSKLTDQLQNDFQYYVLKKE